MTLVADWQAALSRFCEREPLLRAVSPPQATRFIDPFVETVRRRVGRFLLLDPREFFSMGGDSEDAHARRWEELLSALDADAPELPRLRTGLERYSGKPEDSRDLENTIVGYTYE